MSNHCTASYSKCLDEVKLAEKREVTLKVLVGKLVKVPDLFWSKLYLRVT
jgi:hypothetical protein